MVFRMNHLHLKSPDPKKTVEWYVKFVGAEVVSERTDPNGKPTFRLDLHGVPLNVTGYIVGQKLEQHFGLEHVAIDAEDFASEVAKVKASGATILEERSLPDGRKVCFFEGPEGVRLEFLEIK